MDYKFLSVDMSAATFEGLSLSCQRRIALVTTLLIWVGVAYTGIVGAQRLGDSKFVEEVAIIALFGALLHCIAGGEFLMLSAAKALLNVTPLGVLYRQDRSVLDKAKAELLAIASRVDFNDYLEYGKINPAIRSRESLLVVAHQRKRDLQEWVRNVRNLKHLADLVYQIHLVEQILTEERSLLPRPA